MTMTTTATIPDFIPFSVTIELNTLNDLKTLAAMLNSSEAKLIEAGKSWNLTYEQILSTNTDTLWDTIAPHIAPYNTKDT